MLKRESEGGGYLRPVRICVTGSIATDHLMTFEGRFAESLLREQLDKISVSFLTSDLQVRRGGVGGNIAFSLGVLGQQPVLVGAVGKDFDDYHSWLERHGVDLESLHYSEDSHTARFTCTTDSDNNQIASFYPGAMSEARELEIGPVIERVGEVDLVIICPNDPEAMLRHTRECIQRGLPFVADPSQQLSFMGAEQIAELVDGAKYLFTNEYEAALIEQKTGWNGAEIKKRVGTRVTTLGENGSKIETPDGAVISVPAIPCERIVDPTGVGDAFRSGYLAGVAWELSPQRSAELGSMMAALVIETMGPQEYELDVDTMIARIDSNYGSDAANDIAKHLLALK